MKKKLTKQETEKLIIENFAKTFNSIKRLDEQGLEEINFKQGIAALGLAAGLAGAPKDAAAQTLVPKGIERTAAKEMPTQMPSDPLMAGKTILMSFRMNPFTADMWSKRSHENLKMFKLVKKMVDYEANGGTIQDEDRIALGNAYKDSQVGQDFLLRKKDDMTTAKLEEDDEQMKSEDEMISSKKLLMFIDILEKNVNEKLSEYKSKDNSTYQFMVDRFEGYISAIEILRNHTIDMVNKKWG